MLETASAVKGQADPYYAVSAEDVGCRETARIMEQGAAAMREKGVFINVVLSDEAVALAVQSNAAAFARKLEGTTANGESVTVSRAAELRSRETDALEGYLYRATLTGLDGQALDIDFTGDIRATRSSDGALSVYFSESGLTRVYLSDGSVTEAEGDLTDPEGYAVIVNTTGGAVQTGDNGSLVFAYADGTSVTGGNGDDTVRLADKIRDVNVDTGGGNDAVSGSTVYDADIALNGGNNTVSFKTLTGGSLTAGDGGNTITLSKGNGLDIRLGNGGNIFKGGTLGDGSSMSLGDGDNSLELDFLGNNVPYPATNQPSFLYAGNGNNTVTIRRMLGGSALRLGDGGNNLDIFELAGSSSVHAGNGDNSMNIHWMMGDSRVAAGNGNNRISIYRENGASKLSLGDGDNRVGIRGLKDNASVTVGGGRNAIEIEMMAKTASVTDSSGRNVDVTLSIPLVDMDDPASRRAWSEWEQERLQRGEPLEEAMRYIANRYQSPAGSAGMREALDVYAAVADLNRTRTRMTGELIPGSIGRYINDPDLFASMYWWGSK